jgi:N-acetylglucosaminyldiphosphoundecaprenol N-acetyl-beta-D-mannosaminyltransferase
MPSTVAGPALERPRILGAPIDPLTIAEAVDRIAERAAQPRSGAVFVLKPYVEFFGPRATPEVREAFASAWLSLADGVALQWATAYAQRRRHQPVDLLVSLAAIVLRPASVATVVPERVAGVTFTLALLDRCRQRGLGVFLIGSPKRRSIEQTARHLEQILPGLRIVGTAPGRLGGEGEGKILEALRRLRPDVVLVGLGFPLQEQFMLRAAESLEHGVLIGEGGSFDFRELGGTLARAPGWVRRAGLEWLWRLAREPRRAVRQAAIPGFVLRVHREATRAG